MDAVELRRNLLSITTARASMGVILSFKGPDPSCWTHPYQWHACCLRAIEDDSVVEFLPPGNPECWHGRLTFDRCCIGSPWRSHSMGSFASVLGDTTSLPHDRQESSVTCPMNSEPFQVVGFLEAWPDALAAIRRVFRPFDPIHYSDHSDQHRLKNLSAIMLQGSYEIFRNMDGAAHMAVLHLGLITLEPDGGSITFSQWVCVTASEERSALETARTLARLWRPLWSTLALELLETSVGQLPSTWYRAHALSRLAGTELLNMEVFRADDIRPICEAPNDAHGVKCDWGRCPIWAWAAMITLVLPGLISAPKAMFDLLRSDKDTEVLLNIWRVSMIVLVISAELKCVGLFQSFQVSGVYVAWALGVRLQGDTGNLPSRLGRRWTRQIPAKVAVAICFHFVLRGLFTMSLSTRPWLVYKSSPLTLLLDERSSMSLQHYGETELGVLAELFLPPSLWFDIGGYPLKSSVSMWFFRCEATLWVLVMSCRNLGISGWMVLGSVFVAAVCNIVTKAYDPHLEVFEVPEKTFSFVCISYIFASGWYVALRRCPWFPWLSAVATSLAWGLFLYDRESFPTGDAKPGVERMRFWLVKLSWMLLLISGIVGILDIGSISITRAFCRVPFARRILSVLSKLSMGVCLWGWLAIDVVWSGYDESWHWRRKASPLLPCILTSLLASLLSFVFVQKPSEVAIHRLWNALSACFPRWSC